MMLVVTNDSVVELSVLMLFLACSILGAVLVVSLHMGMFRFVFAVVNGSTAS